MTASRRAADVQARSASLDIESDIHRSSVATDTPISCDNRGIGVLSGGSSRATARALKSSEYRAITLPQCPHYLRGIETATTVTRGADGPARRAGPSVGVAFLPG